MSAGERPRFEEGPGAFLLNPYLVTQLLIGTWREAESNTRKGKATGHPTYQTLA